MDVFTLGEHNWLTVYMYELVYSATQLVYSATQGINCVSL